MPEIPLQNREVPNGRHGMDAARMAEGQLPDGTQWNVSVTERFDGFSNSRDYRVVIGSRLASVSVNENGYVFGVRNQNGSVRSPEGQTQASALVTALNTAIASGGISPEELNILASPTESIANMPALAGRASRTRGDGPSM